MSVSNDLSMCVIMYPLHAFHEAQFGAGSVIIDVISVSVRKNSFILFIFQSSLLSAHLFAVTIGCSFIAPCLSVIIVFMKE